MEQNIENKTPKSTQKKNDSTAIRFDKTFMRQVTRLVDKANKKQFGRKVKPKTILVNLFNLADEKLLEKTIQKSQEESLTQSDRKEMFMKENLGRFKGNKEEFEQKMMELMSGFLSQSPT
ncbi:MAG: hypothetical protein CME69_10835 [Halobacteriovorax sp.]|nr:hypothetical protein [Halobacteriovorax sp.]|tara:strand:- start:45 stop:404 length:360 start_codon:yes stop_codon:yes gene_type:complete